MASGYLKDTNVRNVRNDSRIEWMQHANSLIGAARSAKGAEQFALTQMLRDSGDATLQLYALLGEAQPASKPSAAAKIAARPCAAGSSLSRGRPTRLDCSTIHTAGRERGPTSQARGAA